MDEERQRRTRWRTAGAALVLFAICGTVGGSFTERYAWERFGPGDVDEALDRDAEVLDGTIMSSDPTPRGWLVSYEYYFGPTYEVGYQRVTDAQGRRLRFGTGVRVEAMEDPLEGAQFPSSSRLEGTRREPQAWITRLLRSSRAVRLVLAGVLGLIGVWWLARPGA